ncbi:bifunctional tetrahydrofolate synthase/dihydrofolate synthase [Marinomonas primoryensis]|uniref:Dihydrofolate synthase/folylpolyglutamate synthase n=1 Tax=Marinomonas primoryensis TaxID=178399 RepID=A0A859D130_9GAMM|nr:bifunctional tetrahydrofolate synthase/dihydrofolate synthase [Marinomonas primoryensis]QKK80560.1 bifunctional folylpolyglutamate synthase/dihydrofolate synthase [Marinomonas primoryensis]
MTHTSLSSWLSYIESQHPSEIELGLERGSKVLARLNLSRPKVKVITVAGTNGKGSTCAMLTQYLCTQNYSVGTYTSPHFLDFNERIALNNTSCDDDLICRAFEAIEAARENISLTYFEFSTLAALWIFDQSKLDYWVLEVGLGGRLDSVNMIDTDVAVVTSISLDHIDWLGDNLDVIAREKTGIARKDKLLISGVVNPPSSIATTALDVGAHLRQKGIDFSFTSNQSEWAWAGNGVQFDNLPIPSLPLQNAATVIAVLVFMELAPAQEDLATLFRTAQLTGRFQQVASSPDIYIDVAHNPEAAVELARRVSHFSRQPVAVCGMLKDKDIDGVMTYLAQSFSDWFCADLAGPRGARANELVECIIRCSPSMSSKVKAFDSVHDAFDAALTKAKEEQRSVIVFGSFVTVSNYLAFSQLKSDL